MKHGSFEKRYAKRNLNQRRRRTKPFAEQCQIDSDGHWHLRNRKPTKSGYVDVKINGRSYKAHRVIYEWIKGSIPEGLELDHLCRDRSCVNPWHLEPVTHLENIRRGLGGQNSRAKIHCPQGHPYDEENTWHKKLKPVLVGYALGVIGKLHGKECDENVRKLCDRRRYLRASLSLNSMYACSA